MANIISMQNVQMMLYQEKSIMDQFGNAPWNQIKKLDALIQKQISSQGDCDKEGFKSHACHLKRSQETFKSYYQTECTWNKYGAQYPFCEMNLKKDRLIWLDKTLVIK